MATGQNGDKLELTIKVVAAGSGNAEVLWLQSSLGQTQPVWLGPLRRDTILPYARPARSAARCGEVTGGSIGDQGRAAPAHG